jgi:hypothetical protein
MRVGRGLSCMLAACLAVAGCGGGDGGEERAAPAAGVGGEPATASPSADPVTTPQPLRYVHDARAALAAGQIGVVDLSDRAGIEPATMDVNREQTLDGLRWSGWGNPSATGRGEVDTLICDPTCATGRRERSTAVIVLSKPRRCGGRRFYTRSTMTYEQPGTDRTRAPDTYLRTPPC